MLQSVRPANLDFIVLKTIKQTLAIDKVWFESYKYAAIIIQKKYSH